MISTLLSLVLAADQATLAMTSLECYPAKLCSGEREANRAYLQSKLEQAVLGAANNRIKLITPEVVLRILKESGQTEQQARETCLEATCAVDLGGALGADFIVQGRIMRPGTNDWELGLKLWSIAESNVLADESVNASTLLNLKSKMPSLAKQALQPVIKRNRRRKPESSAIMGFDEDERGLSPSIESGQITEALGGLMISGSPSIARVTVITPNRKRLDLTVGDSRKGLDPGTYRWTATANNYESSSGVIQVRPDGFAMIPLKLRKLSNLSITGWPVRAKVEIIGPTGKQESPVGIGSRLRGLIPGVYKLRASRAGYESKTKTIRLAPGSQEEVRFSLPEFGGLSVSGTPTGARVEVRSNLLGFNNVGGLPWKAKHLRSGTYRVIVSRNGYLTAQQDVLILAGEGIKKLNIKLAEANLNQLNSQLPFPVPCKLLWVGTFLSGAAGGVGFLADSNLAAGLGFGLGSTALAASIICEKRVNNHLDSQKVISRTVARQKQSEPSKIYLSSNRKSKSDFGCPSEPGFATRKCPRGDACMANQGCRKFRGNRERLEQQIDRGKVVRRGTDVTAFTSAFKYAVSLPQSRTDVKSNAKCLFGYGSSIGAILSGTIIFNEAKPGSEYLGATFQALGILVLGLTIKTCGER